MFRILMKGETDARLYQSHFEMTMNVSMTKNQREGEGNEQERNK